MPSMLIEVLLSPSQVTAIEDLRGQMPIEIFVGHVIDAGLIKAKTVVNELQDGQITQMLASGYCKEAIALYTSKVVVRETKGFPGDKSGRALPSPGSVAA